jgi:hypothetical protein
MLGDGMLDTDPLGRLLLARLLPGGQLLGRRALGRLGRRRVDPTAKRLGQAPVAGIVNCPGIDGGLGGWVYATSLDCWS